MKFLIKNGVKLAYRDTGSSGSPILLVHGWCCNHTFLAPQAEYFHKSHRVISVDLRGHGQSDAPVQDYSMAAFADDLAWICHELALTKPVMVGHSMGGNVLLEVAARYPDIPAAIVMIDSVVTPPQLLLDVVSPLAETLRRPDYLATLVQAAELLFIPADGQELKTQSLAGIEKTPQHVILSSFVHHITQYDASIAAANCHLPIAYIAAEGQMSELDRFRALCPHLITAKTLGAGHFSPLSAADQINTMLERFVKLYANGNHA